ncbi:SDR family oxidoreductase [Halorubellus sp. JP-L1]|uniref:SDR family NAD(P)-dependent oxidoreductase n=1 Tax=Halorubellus sp. JP-L1 TaxID=2715753 RepID=UPI0014079011|nr:SDR family oxidoreductase [Halorubellus sp. JP-L1]NHN42993.1 SDR family oxidoreductase [Halorubellus sp. JP-L1]
MSVALDGKAALVTGGASGIGRGIALAFADAGADVVVGDLQRNPKDADATEPTHELVRERGRRGAFVETDVADPSDAEALVERSVDALGALDVVANVAGVFPKGTVADTPAADWNRTFDVNVDGIYHVLQHAVPELSDGDHGRIINVASQLGLVGREEAAAYCATKGAIVNLTRQLALDYADDGITVNAIAPGVVRTSMTEDKIADPEQGPELDDAIPAPFFGEPEDVGHAAVYLASDGARYVNGHTLVVDGGYTAR